MISARTCAEACGVLALTLCFSLGGVGASLAQSNVLSSSYQLDLTVFAQHPGGVTNPTGGANNPAGAGSDFGAIDVTAPRDGSGRVFVSSQEGNIFAFDSDGASLGTFLNIPSSSTSTGFINGGGATAFRGLMYFDFHPDYATAGTDGFGKIYTGFQIDENNNARASDYSHPSPQNANKYVIGEWTVDPNNPNAIDTSTYREVFRITTEGNNPHAIGEIAFNPLSRPGDDDFGLLYAALGDGSAGGNAAPDPGYLQTRENALGSIIRINPLEDTANGNSYSIPSNNPFFGEGGPNPGFFGEPVIAQELYGFGFRDPQNFGFARDNNGETVVITFDIGAFNREEISLVRPGGNYGFERFEGTDQLRDGAGDIVDRPLNADFPHSPPVVEYTHSTGFAIVGGLLVSDPDDPNFQNKVLFSDLPTGKVFFSDYQEMLDAEANGTLAPIFEINNFTEDGVVVTENAGGGGVTFEDVVGAGTIGARGDARFGFDEAGNVYIVSKQTSNIYRTGLVAVSAVPELSGDFNFDGVVNTADYSVWRDGLGTLFEVSDYELWRRNVGATSQANALAVPEPGAMVLLVLTLSVRLARPRGRVLGLFA